MIRCNGFCVTVDPGQTLEATEVRAGRINRVRNGAIRRLDLGPFEGLAIPLDEGEDSPVVHGFFANGGTCGEFSVLEQSGESMICRRDPAGTRPLYVADKGDWVASDHRFMLGEDWTLLPPGSSYDVRERRVTHPLQKSPEPFDDTFEDAALALARLVEDAVRRRTAGHDKVAVAFSGGLDSSLLAHCSSKCTKTVAISVGAVGSHDESKAPAAAEELGIELRRVSANTDDVKNELAKLDLPFAVGPMDKSLWCIYSLASKAAAEEGADIVILGQLADELFGGYAKYQTVLVEGGQRRAAEMMSLDVAGCGTRGFLRDEAACSMWIEPRFPFADEEILEFGSRLPVPYKIAGHERKAILRTAAANLGVPKRICDAPKKAAQYSSGLLKLYQQFI